MYILRSWRDSLFLLAPSNLKLFLLVTLKSTWETYKILFTRWVPIVVMLSVVGLTYVQEEIFLPSLKHATAFPPMKLGIYLLLCVGVATFSLCLQRYIGYVATRPSIGLKNNSYFLSFWRHFILLVLLSIITIGFVLLSMLILNYLLGLILKILNMQLQYAIRVPLELAIQCPFNIAILFFLDSDGSLKELWKSVVRTVTMTLYNLPMVSILCVLEVVSFWFCKALGLYATWWLILLPFIMNIPIINLWTNLYIKRVHEQPDLYFDLPK